MKILVLNAGSSSQKSCLYDLPTDKLPSNPPEPLWEGQLDWTHQQEVVEMSVKTAAGAKITHSFPVVSRAEDTLKLLETLWRGSTQVLQQPTDIDIVGHRVVHGGETYRDSTRITSAVKEAIAHLSTLAPAHNPANLAGITAIESILGTEIPQIAVFDTAYHSYLPLPAATYPIPYEWFEKGIRRYGFHGISHQYCAQRAAQLLDRNLKELRLITCHLGNGCSLAAIHDGYSIDTTMGFTPLDGLMMGTRSGAVDPGILIHLMRQEGYAADTLDQLLNKDSGLKGVSGISGDMRKIMEAIAQGHERAQLALDVYIHRLQSSMGAMLASLAGLDVLVFTAGVGEHSALVRERACQGFEFLGLKLDVRKNQHAPKDEDIATPDSAVRVLVIHTQEDWAIAQHCWRYLTNQQG